MSQKVFITNVSKAMSYLLRHGAVQEKVPVRVNGYMYYNDLISWLKTQFKECVTEEIIDTIVSQDSKHRYSVIIENGEKLVCANQGHSINVDVELQQIDYDSHYPIIHGGYSKNRALISESSLSPMGRQYVHYISGKDPKNFELMRKDVDTYYIPKNNTKFLMSTNGVIHTKEISFQNLIPIYFEKGLLHYGGIIFCKDHVLLVKNIDTNTYGFPNGKKEYGEHPMMTALREVYEKTSLKPEQIIFLPMSHNISELSNNGKKSAVGYFFAKTKEMHNVSVLDKSYVEWIHVDNAKKLLHEKQSILLTNIDL